MEDDFERLNIEKTIIDTIEDHFIVCKLDGTIVFSNKALQRYLGYEENQLFMKNFIDIIADTHKDKAKRLIVNSTEKTSDYEDFLFESKFGVTKLNLKTFIKDDLLYIYGNEKYIEYDRIRQKLNIEIGNAIKIHKQSLPEELPNREDISFASLYIPAEELGGDLYDVFKVDNGLLDDYYDQYVSFIADVSGHGLDSAMLAIFVKDTIKSYFNHKHSSGQILSPKDIMNFFVKEYIKEGYPTEYLVCIFLVVIDLKTNELTYCNAGFHMPPILVHDKDNIIQLDKGGFPVTTALDLRLYNYKDNTIKLSDDMTLFLMSDGLAEQRSKNEIYENRLIDMCSKIYNLQPSQIVEEIHRDFIGFLDYNDIDDDITLVVAKLSR